MRSEQKKKLFEELYSQLMDDFKYWEVRGLIEELQNNKVDRDEARDIWEGFKITVLKRFLSRTK